MISFHKVDFNFKNNYILQKINLEVEEGIFLGLIGPNGGGKTTLLKLLLGLIKGYTGDIKVFNKPPHQLTKQRPWIGYYPQKQNINWNFPISVSEVVLMGVIPKTGIFKSIIKEDREYADHLLDILNLYPHKNKSIGQLSGGQQQKAFLARALVSKPKLLILDEPTSNLDTTSQLHFVNQIIKLKEDFNLTVIMVSHDVNSLANNADKLVCLNRSIHFCDKSELITHEMIEHAYTCELETFRYNRQKLHGIYHD